MEEQKIIEQGMKDIQEGKYKDYTNVEDMFKEIESDKEKQQQPQIECLICGFKTMKNITACHLRCSNCGSEMDCSDKGLTW
jgi:hypothetical protein